MELAHDHDDEEEQEEEKEKGALLGLHGGFMARVRKCCFCTPLLRMLADSCSGFCLVPTQVRCIVHLHRLRLPSDFYS